MHSGLEPEPQAGGRPRRRSPRLSPASASNSSSLQEAKRRGRMKNREHEQLAEQLQNLDLGNKQPASGTGLVYSDIFTAHRCLWDPSHPECPARVTSIMEGLDRQSLRSRCVSLEPKPASEEDLLLVHTKEYIDLIKSTQSMTEAELQKLSDNYDSVYLNKETFQVSLSAVGSLLQLVDKVMTSELRNGFSVARPPGHHAQSTVANGYSVFNNVALAARYAQKTHNVSRVLIVDWDVHHGQGIQYIFQEDPSVLYFSVHRYEQGTFWPHLSESDSSAIGTGAGQGFNINLPWNKTGMADADYIAAFQQLLLPVAYEFQPELILVAAGFDCLVGDPKGEMCCSPQCLSVLTHMLMGLADGRVLLSLEGGYNLQSTAEGAAACIRSLLGDPCPTLVAPSTAPSTSALKSISDTISALYPYWSSLQVLENEVLAEGEVLRETDDYHTATVSPAKSAGLTTGLVYDPKMMEHHNMWSSHPEQPQRIARIFSKHEDLGLVDRCQRIPSRLATEEELALCHGSSHISLMKSTEEMKARDLYRLGPEFNSIYFNNQSYQCALMAAGSCFNTAQHILTGKVCNGVAIVRPPGHHAEKDTPCGFCFFNTAALTARYAQSLTANLRVLILDWDVHHGNGTQHIFEEDKSVLYISLHRYEHGTFFPGSDDAGCDRVGIRQGAGFNVNIPWNDAKMGDSEYLAAFHAVVMPIAREFNPGLVIVSAGFDAARGDPLGQYKVTPEGYAHMTHLLMSLAGGKVLVILEGGYNLQSISDSMAMCTSVLLGDVPPPLATPMTPPLQSAVKSINEVIRYHSPYWSSLRLHLSESTRSLATPKHCGKRGSKGKGRRSTEEGVDQLAQGLASLDISQSTSASRSPASVPVGGARQKVRPAPRRSSKEDEVKAVSADVTSEENQPAVSMPQPQAVDTTTSEPAACGAQMDVGGCKAEPAEVLVSEGACGWSKPQTALELIRGQLEDGSTMHVVQPLPWCPHLDAVKPVPTGGIDISLPCKDCGSEAENWICLICYQVFCGRYVNEHMLIHGTVAEHPIVLSFADLSVWCYSCDSYVHNQVLFEAKNSAHYAKFQEEIPPFSQEGSTSVPVVGAREKVCPAPRRSSKEDKVKAGSVDVTSEENQPAVSMPQSQTVATTTSGPAAVGGCKAEPGEELVSEGACGWSKPQTALELVCGQLEDGSTMHVVQPLPWCPHLDAVKPVPTGGIDIFLPCKDCGSETENWICLICFQVYCGRYVNEHMVIHGTVAEHPIVLSFADLSVWCYSCDSYVHNEVLFEAKNSAHYAKFQEEIPAFSREG